MLFFFGGCRILVFRTGTNMEPLCRFLVQLWPLTLNPYGGNSMEDISDSDRPHNENEQFIR